MYIAFDVAIDADMLALHLTFHHASLSDVHESGLRNDIAVHNPEVAHTVIEDDIAVNCKACGEEGDIKRLGLHRLEPHQKSWTSPDLPG
ncbi:hypothetical protein PTKU64_91460 (plasmid) [Paraburkholderia terrae]|uniref:Uncharacterized protein n=1 Tax=Paraburkholderia terrae TaxID=311230 RepID=A0ABM7UB72_9BURK|nr:hypothetical protein PTKU64_91460 [Paraburkholderia terrae]